MAFRPTTVYGLRSDGGRIRYVGQTIQSLDDRLKNHIRHARKYSHRKIAIWINKEISLGHKVTIFIIEANAVCNFAEIRWIAFYRKHGAKLLNATAGGQGGRIGKKSPEERAKISKALKGKKKSPEHVEAMRRVVKKPMTQEHKDKISAALKGKMPKNLKTIQAGNKGIVRPQELRDRISASLKGRQTTSTKQLLKNLGR